MTKDNPLLRIPKGNPAALANARQVGGDHYKYAGGEEHWDRVARLKLNYHAGNVTKYVERAPLKHGLEDLEKARHYLDKLIELVKAGHYPEYKR